MTNYSQKTKADQGTKYEQIKIKMLKIFLLILEHLEMDTQFSFEILKYKLCTF